METKNDVPDEVKKESTSETISRLKRHIGKLHHALNTIDSDIDRAARKYINSTAPHGSLKFHDFLDLLVLEIKRKVIEENGCSLQLKGSIGKYVRQMVEIKMAELLPTLKGKISDYIKIPILIIPSNKRYQGNGAIKFQAMCLVGSIRHGGGDTPENAYKDLRDRIVIELLSKGPRDFLTRDMNQMPAYHKSPPFLTETLEGWTLEVRLRA